MSILRREYEDLTALREAIDRMLGDPLLAPKNWIEGRILGTIPTIDIYETDEALVILATLPGVAPEDLEVSVMGDVLTIKGEVKVESEVEEGCYLCRERRQGTLMRSISLPTSVNVDAAEAVFENGVLKLALPKSEVVKPKTIKVKAK